VSHCYNITKHGEGWRVWVKPNPPELDFTVRPDGECDWGQGDHIMTLDEAKAAVGINRALWSTLRP
jgi:hypothetical protein